MVDAEVLAVGVGSQNLFPSKPSLQCHYKAFEGNKFCSSVVSRCLRCPATCLRALRELSGSGFLWLD